MPVQRRTNLGHYFVHRDLLGRGPRGHPRHLPIQIRFLIRRRHPRVHRRRDHRRAAPQLVVHENQPSHRSGRHRQRPARNQRYDVTRATPLRSAHIARFIHPFLQHTTDN